MCPIDDGVIKYDRSQYEQTPPLNEKEILDLEKWRSTLFQIHLIGEYLPEKIGYGNLSEKKNYSSLFQSTHPQFVITGTQTGGHPVLTGQFYTRVLDYDLENQKIKVQGPVEASSEALTHAAIYHSNPKIGAVFHIHSKEIWKGMIREDYPFTEETIPYGTKEMANAVREAITGKTYGSLVMKGHEDGVIAFGKDNNEAGREILKIYDKFGG